ncbi:MAG: Small-conductance mechanosensitive channel [Anaerolineae bacterium]|nr:Small-conductance mechanosensitive channel [Anaerolineae bacterium]
MQNILDELTPLQALFEQIILFTPKLIVALIIFALTLLLAKICFQLVRRALQHRQTDPEVSLLLARVTQISILVLGIIWALSAVDFNVTGFVAGLGIAGFTVGFALKDIAENFVAGVLLLLQQPFDIGEAVEAGGYAGTVTNIEIRSTTIRTWDGLLVIIPNAQVYGNPITNYSKIERRRISLDVGVLRN